MKNAPQSEKERFARERKESFRKQYTTIDICTRVPSKWRFVDLETGEIWQYSTEEERFKLAQDIEANYVSGNREMTNAGTQESNAATETKR